MLTSAFIDCFDRVISLRIFILLMCTYCMASCRREQEAALVINAENNYEMKTKNFIVSKPTRFHLLCNFESFPLKSLDGDYLDGVRLFFDVDHSRSSVFERGRDKKFIFYYGKSFPTSSGIIYSFFAKDSNHSFLEIAIPWKQIGVVPEMVNVMGFDCSVVDNDGSGNLGENKQMIWNSEDGDIFLNPTLYGDLSLGKYGIKMDSISKGINSSYIKHDIKVDGHYDDVWKLTAFQKMENVAIGVVKSESDLKVEFKSLYNEEFIYFLFSVTDDVRIWEDMEFKLCDFGWIEDDRGNIVWEVPRKGGLHAGGDSRNRVIDSILVLPRGSYKAFFVTDESHSPVDWLVAPPNNTKRYGLQLTRVP